MRENRRGQEGWEGRQKRCRPDPREGERREAGWERPGRRAVPGSVGRRPGRGAARMLRTGFGEPCRDSLLVPPPRAASGGLSTADCLS